MQPNAASANAVDNPRLILRMEPASLVEEPAGDDDDDDDDDDDVGLEPADDDVAVPLVELEDVGGATAASALTVNHEAAELAALLPCVYGRKETIPLLVSWTRAVILAKYVAEASFVVGPASCCVSLFCVAHT
jgi:hypothetical protein